MDELVLGNVSNLLLGNAKPSHYFFKWAVPDNLEGRLPMTALNSLSDSWCGIPV